MKKPPGELRRVHEVRYVRRVLNPLKHKQKIRSSLIVRFMGPSWGPSGADRPQVGPTLGPWTLLSGLLYRKLPYSPVIHYHPLSGRRLSPTCLSISRSGRFTVCFPSPNGRFLLAVMSVQRGLWNSLKCDCVSSHTERTTPAALLVWMMACCLFGFKPLYKPTLIEIKPKFQNMLFNDHRSRCKHSCSYYVSSYSGIGLALSRW